jgi:hypothetical protein
VPLVYTREGFIPPWKPGLAQVHCANRECATLVVAITRTRGFCAACTRKLGVKPEDPPAEEQLEIPLF